MMMMIAVSYVLYSLSLVVFNVRLTISQTRTDYANVMDAIFNTRGYNKKVLPRLNITTPVLLDIDLDFLGIDAINEISEIMTSSGFLGVSWKDTGLSWIPKYYGNLDTIFVPQNDIWKPDIFLVNGYRKIVELGASFYYIEVDHTGTTTWLPFEVFESRCTLDTKRFPFDKQNCNITFSLLSLSEREVRIRECRRGLVLDAEFQENSVWRITSTDCIVHDEADDSYNNIVFIFNIERRPLYYIMNIILPIMFLGFLNGLAFVIPADSGEKMGYSVTVFLSLVVFFTMIGNLLPVSLGTVHLIFWGGAWDLCLGRNFFFGQYRSKVIFFAGPSGRIIFFMTESYKYRGFQTTSCLIVVFATTICLIQAFTTNSGLIHAFATNSNSI